MGIFAWAAAFVFEVLGFLSTLLLLAQAYMWTGLAIGAVFCVANYFGIKWIWNKAWSDKPADQQLFYPQLQAAQNHSKFMFSCRLLGIALMPVLFLSGHLRAVPWYAIAIATAWIVFLTYAQWMQWKNMQKIGPEEWRRLWNVREAPENSMATIRKTDS